MTEPVQSYIDGEINGVVIRPLNFHNDPRGWLVELFRQDELVEEWWPVMTYVSQTLPGITRGPHEHVEQTDGFAFLGPSDFRLVLWDIRFLSAHPGLRAWSSILRCFQPGGGLDSTWHRTRLSQHWGCAGIGLQRSEPTFCRLG